MPLALDSGIFGPLFSDEEIAGLFDDEAFLRNMLAVEGALARVESSLGIIPFSAGERISDVCKTVEMDPQLIDRSTRRDGVPVISLVKTLPISFGFKVAGWLAPLLRHRKRIAEQHSRLLQLQFDGAAGTLAALSDKGLAVMRGLSRELSLNEPVMPWHCQRDCFGEFAGWLSMLSASLAKMAQDIILLAQNEVGAVVESGGGDRGGSSSMPQKQNPICSG
ncbi:MAG: hypothetical protein GY850_00710 [bacterium]|nr:hypothetical protein [bacterium]